MDSGKLIVIEGACDGIGKSTQFELLYNKLFCEWYYVFKHHFPTYGSFQASAVEKYLNGDFGLKDNLSMYFVHSLYAHDRAITWYSDLKKHYDDGDILLLDRYTTSSIIYQTALIDNIKDKISFIDFINDYEYNKLGIKKPDMVIFLKASFDLITKMRNSRKNNDGICNDIHERDLNFMKKVYENALFVAEYLKWDIVNCEENNEMRSIEDIHNDIWTLVKRKI